MTYHLTDDVLTAYLYQTLSEEEEKQAHLHLATCDHCRTQLSEYEQVQGYIQHGLVAYLQNVTPSPQINYAQIRPALIQAQQKRQREPTGFDPSYRSLGVIASGPWSGPQSFTQFALGAASLLIIILSVTLLTNFVQIFDQADRLTQATQPNVSPVETLLGATATLSSNLLLISDTLGPKITATLGTPRKDNDAQTFLQTDRQGIQVHPQGNARQNVQHLKALGLNWVKLDLEWSRVAAQPPDERWVAWDEVIKAYHEADMQILISLIDEPSDREPNGFDRTALAAHSTEQASDLTDLYEATGFGNLSSLAQVAAEVAQRYEHQVQAIEVWPTNHLMPVLQQTLTPTQYMALLEATHTAVKASNPKILIIGTIEPHVVDDVAYLHQLYNLGLAELVDAIGLHPTTQISSPTYMEAKFTAYRQIMRKFDDVEKAIWLTRFGWPAQNGSGQNQGVQGFSLIQQARYITQTFALGQTRAWLGPMFLFNLDYALVNEALTDHEERYFSLLNPAGPRSAYFALQDLHEQQSLTASIRAKTPSIYHRDETPEDSLQLTQVISQS